MARILVIYHSIKGPVAQVAEEIAAGAGEVPGSDVTVESVHDVTDEDMLAADGIAFGCMKFYGSLTPEITALFERLYPLRDQMRYTAGVSFSGSPNQYGGQEQAMLTLTYAMLMANIIVLGDGAPEMGYIGGFIASQPMSDKAQRANRAIGRRLAEVAECLRQGRQAMEKTK